MADATHDAVVIGAGIAGMATAGKLAESGRATALIDDGYMGGLVMNVGVIEGGPDHGGQSGADLVDRYLTQALEAGADYRIGPVTTLTREEGLWRLPEHEIAAKTAILATGARLRQLGVPGEERLTGRGVSQCAFCDGGLYRGDDVIVVGGGDAAFQEALHLAELAGRVRVLIRGDGPRARQDFQDRLAAHANVEIRTGADVLEIVGDEGVDAVRLIASGSEEMMTTRAVFVFVGVEPAAELAPAEAARNHAGALEVDPTTLATAAPGFHAVGAVRSGHDGSIVGALADAEIVRRAVAQ